MPKNDDIAGSINDKNDKNTPKDRINAIRPHDKRDELQGGSKGATQNRDKPDGRPPKMQQ